MKRQHRLGRPRHGSRSRSGRQSGSLRSTAWRRSALASRVARGSRTARHPIHRWAQSARTLQTSRTHHVLQPALFLLARPSVDRVHHQPACERASSSLTHRLGTATLPTPRHYRSCYPPPSVSRLIRTDAGAGRESEPVLVTVLTKRPRQSAGAHSVTLSPVTSTASSGIRSRSTPRVDERPATSPRPLRAAVARRTAPQTQAPRPRRRARRTAPRPQARSHRSGDERTRAHSYASEPASKRSPASEPSSPAQS